MFRRIYTNHLMKDIDEDEIPEVLDECMEREVFETREL